MKHVCPIYRKETNSELHADVPFCSARCRTEDLGNWSSEKYVVTEPLWSEEDFETLMESQEPNERKH